MAICERHTPACEFPTTLNHSLGANRRPLLHFKFGGAGMAHREVARVEIQEIVRRKPQVVFQDEERHAFLPWNGESTMRSPTGATPRSNRTTTSSTSSLSIRCLSPSALLARRWRSGWTASWCTSTVGAACSRPTSASPGWTVHRTRRALGLHHQGSRPHQSQQQGAGPRRGRFRRPALGRPPALGQAPAGPQAPPPGRTLPRW